MLNGRKLISAKDKIHPKYSSDLSNYSDTKQIVQFNIGDQVLALNVQRGPKWYSAIVVEQLAVNVYNVYVEELDIIWKRHKNQLAFVSSKKMSINANPPTSNDKFSSASLPSDSSDDINIPASARVCRTRQPPVRFGFT